MSSLMTEHKFKLLLRKLLLCQKYNRTQYAQSKRCLYARYFPDSDTLFSAHLSKLRIVFKRLPRNVFCTYPNQSFQAKVPNRLITDKSKGNTHSHYCTENLPAFNYQILSCIKGNRRVPECSKPYYPAWFRMENSGRNSAASGNSQYFILGIGTRKKNIAIFNSIYFAAATNSFLRIRHAE